MATQTTSDDTSRLQPAIGAAGLNALRQSAVIANRYGTAKNTPEKPEDERYSVLDKLPLKSGKLVQWILKRYQGNAVADTVADGIGSVDAINRRVARNQFDEALTNGPKNREDRQSPEYATWGWVTASGTELLKIGANVGELFGFYLNVTSKLALALAPFTEGTTLPLAVQLEGYETAADTVSSGFGLAATEAAEAHLDYRAVISQDGSDPAGAAAAIRKDYQDNNVDQVWNRISFFFKFLKFLNVGKQVEVAQSAQGFIGKADGWTQKAKSLLSRVAGTKWMARFEKAASWAQRMGKIVAFAQAVYKVGENLYNIVKSTGIIAWETGKLAAVYARAGAKAIGQGAKWAGHKVAEGATAAWGWAKGLASKTWTGIKGTTGAAKDYAWDHRRAITEGTLGAVSGIGFSAGFAHGEYQAHNPFTGDGDLTGPYYPQKWNQKHLENPEEALKIYHATVYINGIATMPQAHADAAQQLAEDLNQPVVGVFNASGVRKGGLGKTPSGIERFVGAVRDIAQCVGDKFYDLGQNPATATMVRLIQNYGTGLHIVAHSQGSIIVSEALRQSARGHTDISNLDVTTYGNASWTFPAGPAYHHRIHDSDPVASVVGTGSTLGWLVNRVSPLRWLVGKAEGVPLADATSDTTVLPSNRKYAGSHDIYTPGGSTNLPGHNDYLADAPTFAKAESQNANKPGYFSNSWYPGISTPAWVRGFLPGWLGGLPAAAPPGPATERRPDGPFGNVGNAFAEPLRRETERHQDGVGPHRLQRNSLSPFGGSGATDFQLSSQLDPGLLRAALLQGGGGGSAVPEPLRTGMAGAVGFDPSAARLHTGPAAAAAAQGLSAEAFTIGRDVFFGAGAYDPHTPQGQGLIAHELTHVGQQTGTGATRAQTSLHSPAAGDTMERDAQRIGAQVASGMLSLPHPPEVGAYQVSYDVQDYDLSAADRSRLSLIARNALADAKQRLMGLGLPAAEIETVDAAVEIDLMAMTDEEATQIWADALVSAIAAAAMTAPRNPSANFATASGVQRSAALSPDQVQTNAVHDLPRLLAGGVMAAAIGLTPVGAILGGLSLAWYLNRRVNDAGSLGNFVEQSFFQRHPSGSSQDWMGHSFGLQRRPIAPSGGDRSWLGGISAAIIGLFGSIHSANTGPTTDAQQAIDQVDGYRDRGAAVAPVQNDHITNMADPDLHGSYPEPALPPPAEPASPATSSPARDWMRVERGQEIFNSEGQEQEFRTQTRRVNGRRVRVQVRNPFFSRRAHVPPGASGVTIGRGYDLGQHTRDQIINDLTTAGLSLEDATLFAGAANLRGDQARQWNESHINELPVITQEQQSALFNRTYAERVTYAEGVIDRYVGTHVPNHAATESGLLHRSDPVVQETIADLFYRGDWHPQNHGHTVDTRPHITPFVGNERLTMEQLRHFREILADEAIWRPHPEPVVNGRVQSDQRNVPRDRFARRLQMIDAEIARRERQPERHSP